MDIRIEKSKIRKIYKEKRLSLLQSELGKRSKQISNNFIKELFPTIFSKNSNKIFSIYLPSNNEVETRALINFFKNNNIRFCYPKIIAKDYHLEFIIATKYQKFQSNSFFPKVIEPVSGEKALPDFIILPLLAFDKNLTRVGMGGGFFDRTIEFIKQKKSEVCTIALAYEFQRANKDLPNEKTDQTLDFVVTEEAIFSRS